MTGKKRMGMGNFPNAERQMKKFEMDSDKIGMKIRKGGVKVIGNTKQAVDSLETLSEMGFTKKRTGMNRKKNDPYGKIGL